MLISFPASAQPTSKSIEAPAANLSLTAAKSELAADALLDPQSTAWTAVPARSIALNRTPPLYDTDPVSTAEISSAEVRVARTDGKLLVHLAWHDATDDTAEIAQPPATPPEQRRIKGLTQESGRFFDAAAVMYPANTSTGIASPSLQMGDLKDPVTIYYWNAARGPMLLKAEGRGTTQRTGERFPARGVYQAGQWQVAMQLPAMPAGVPLAFAVWNGSQLDRDGRKYFSVWYRLQ